MILHVVYNTLNIHELIKDFFSVNLTESVGEGFIGSEVSFRKCNRSNC